MDYGDWRPFYEKIVADFGYSQRKDEAVAAELDRVLGGARVAPEALRSLLEGRAVTVIGNGPRVAEEIDRVKGLVLTADEATTAALAAGLRPAVLVTDLDGRVEDQIAANEAGAIAVVHGHGDNGPAVRRWAARFRGRTVATTQAEPSGTLHNFGGFTDGDRAVFLADHFGASRIHLVGFDFEHPSPKDADRATKLRKLDWAYVLLSNLARDDLPL